MSLRQPKNNMQNNILNKPGIKQKTTRPELKGSWPHQLATDPFLDWVIILVVCAVTSLALVGVGIRVYFVTERKIASMEVVSDKKSPLPLDTDSLNKVISQFGTRLAEYNAIRKSSVNISDPSLP
jgi:hypothetical protein